MLGLVIDHYKLIVNSTEDHYLMINLIIFWDQVIKGVNKKDSVSLDFGSYIFKKNEEYENWIPVE